jgi:hypothetical protein
VYFFKEKILRQEIPKEGYIPHVLLVEVNDENS